MKKFILAVLFILNFTGMSEAQTSRHIQSSDVTGALGYTPIQSLGGMTGVITCGAGLTCSAQAVTLSTFPVTSLSGLGTGVATALGVNIGSNGSPVVFNGAGGTPSSLVGTNITGIAAGLTAGVASAVAVGGITGAGTGCVAWLTTPSSSNLRGCISDESGSGLLYFQNGDLGTPSAGVGTNITALNATQLTTGTIPTARLNLGQLANSLGADVLLNNTANYFDGPSVAQGTTGTWYASGTVTLFDSVTAVMNCKLWDGTTVISSAAIVVLNTTSAMPLSLSGVITSPAANIRISCRDTTNTTGKILFNQSSNSKDSTVTAFRIN